MQKWGAFCRVADSCHLCHLHYLCHLYHLLPAHRIRFFLHGNAFSWRPHVPAQCHRHRSKPRPTGPPPQFALAGDGSVGDSPAPAEKTKSRAAFSRQDPTRSKPRPPGPPPPRAFIFKLSVIVTGRNLGQQDRRRSWRSLVSCRD